MYGYVYCTGPRSACRNDEGEDDEDEDAEAAASDGSQSDRGEGEEDADRTLGSQVDSATTQKISARPASATSDTVVNLTGAVPPTTSSSAPSDSRSDSTCMADLERCLASISLNVCLWFVTLTLLIMHVAVFLLYFMYTVYIFLYNKVIQFSFKNNCRTKPRSF